MKIPKILYALAAAVLPGSCIKNDIPYPYREGFISEIQVEDMQGEPVINRQERTVDITVGEEALLNELRITRLLTGNNATLTPQSKNFQDAGNFPKEAFQSAEALPEGANTVVDATTPFQILLTTYQEYLWTLRVTQNIERYVEAEKQMGQARMDLSTHSAIVYVEPGTDLRQINITRMKLEGANTTITPDPATVHDFTRPQRFVVTRGQKEISQWTVDVQYSEVVAQTGSVAVRARRATLQGGMKGGTTPGVQYRPQGSSTWITLPAAAVSITSAVSFSAKVTGLTDGTTYEWRVVVDGESSDVATFTTEKIQAIPNLNFDTWTQEGANWYANPVADNYSDPQAYWASGNEGVTSRLAGGKDATTSPVDGSDAYKGRAAKMVSLTEVPLVGAAAGNLFIGTYKTNVSSPKDSPQFGRPFTGARPDGLRGYYKYTGMPITSGTKPGTLSKDECHIYMRLWDAQGNVLAYGEFVGTESVSQYKPFELRLTYTRDNVAPAKLTIVATSSHYGGDFEGAKVVGQVGAGSTLWVDEFEVIYD